MTPAEALDTYRRLIAECQESITLRRTGSTDLTVRARVMAYTPQELVGGIVQGDRRIVVMAEDVTFTGGLQRGDKAVVRGRLLNIEAVDDNTRRVGSTLIAYNLQVRG